MEIKNERPIVKIKGRDQASMAEFKDKRTISEIKGRM